MFYHHAIQLRSSVFEEKIEEGTYVNSEEFSQRLVHQRQRRRLKRPQGKSDEKRREKERERAVQEAKKRQERASWLEEKYKLGEESR